MPSNEPERKGTKTEVTRAAANGIKQRELAARWRISHRTLERWRWIGDGPKCLKIGGRVICRLADVEEYEQMIIRSSTSEGWPRSSEKGSDPKP